MTRRTREDWRRDILAHLHAYPGRWMSAADIKRGIAGTTRGSRGIQHIRDTCAELAAEGLTERLEAAPYGRPASYYRVRP